MQVLILDQAQVARLLPMDECMAVMEEALATLSRGRAFNPLRHAMPLPGGAGVLGMMPGYMEVPEAMGIKVVSVMPGNHGTAYDAHQGAVLLFETKHGALQAMMDASEITAVRTAAVSGVATRWLAREDAGDLAILGAGIQATTHLAAMLQARTLRRVRVWSRTAVSAQGYARRASARHGIRVEPMPSAREAVEGADLICTVTSAPEPVLHGAWIAPGAHVNAAGSSVAFTRELDTAAVVRARLFVDRRESTLNEAGDFLFPKKEGAITDEHIQGELGEIILGQHAGRETPEEITLFKSLGLAVEDVAAAHHLYRKAVEQGVGVRVDWGGQRHDAT